MYTTHRLTMLYFNDTVFEHSPLNSKAMTRTGNKITFNLPV